MNDYRDEPPVRMTMTRDVEALNRLKALRKISFQKDCDRSKKEKQNWKKMNLKPAVLALCFILLTSIGGWSQEATPGVENPLLPVYLIASGLLIILILVIAVVRIVYRAYRLFAENMDREKAVRLGIQYIAAQSWWEKLWQNANALVPMEQEKTIELDHDYDGIRELDNHLPPWWKGLFYASIVFSVVYLFMFHVVNSLPLPEEEYQNELAQAESQARILKASQPASVFDENALSFTNDAAIIARGKSVFTSNNCASCHRADGGGNSIGPNLTDAYWLHGGDIKSIFKTIKVGVVEKAMPAWGKVMNQNDVKSLAFYVMSLQGSAPQNGKAPQGELFRPKPEAGPTIVNEQK